MLFLIFSNYARFLLILISVKKKQKVERDLCYLLLRRCDFRPYSKHRAQCFPRWQHRATNDQTTLTTLKHSIEFTYSSFPWHFKLNRDKVA